LRNGGGEGLARAGDECQDRDGRDDFEQHEKGTSHETHHSQHCEKQKK
jgi:hypothetical protein